MIKKLTFIPNNKGGGGGRESFSKGSGGMIFQVKIYP